MALRFEMEQLQGEVAMENNFSRVVDALPGMVWTALPDGKIDFVNHRWCEYIGVEADEASCLSWKSAIYPGDLAQFLEGWRCILSSGEPGEIEVRLRRFDGDYRRFLVSGNPMRDDGGQIVRWFAMNTDIEDRRRAEDALRRSEEFLAQGQRLNLTGTFAWNLHTDEITFSEQLYRIFELDPSLTVTLERIRTRVHPEDIPLWTERRELAGEDINDHDYGIRLRMPDGRIKYLRTKSYGIRHSTGRLEHIGAIQDVTEHRLAEDALSKLRSELAHMSRVTTLGTLTASIAHEVHQPLAGIMTNASTCLRMLAGDPPDIDGACTTTRRIIRDGNRASEVIARLRTLFSKKETTIEPVDINEATLEIIALSLSELQRDRVILRQELADDLPLVAGDRVQLQQVILNLLRNASDAMSGVDDRSRELVIRTERDEGDYVRLTVKDAGVGITPEDVERVFDAFYTTKIDGMGMGLSVSRSIIESHHGKLWAIPNDGPGANFSFSLPRIPEGNSDNQNLEFIRMPGETDATNLGENRWATCVGSR
jgi:PAS domain S-box-containing protein